MRLSFYNRQNSIYFSLTENYDRVRLFTGILLPGEHEFKDGKFFGPQAKDLNAFLDVKREEIMSLWRMHKDVDVVKKLYKPELYRPTPKSEYDLVYMVGNYVKDARYQNKLSKSTIFTYENVHKHINNYSVLAGSLDLQDHAIDPKDALHVRKLRADRFTGYFRGFDDYLSEKGYSLNTRVSMLTVAKVFINAISKQYYMTLPSIPVPAHKSSPVTVLMPDFVKRFVSDEYGIYKSLDNDLKYSWEIAATILVTTFRISDAQSLSMNDIMEKDGGMFIIKQNKKTGQHSYLPLPKTMVDIYRKNYTQYGNLFTPHSKEFYIPEGIRDVFKMIDEMHAPMTVRKIGVKGEEIIKTMPTYMAVHPHMLRRTAITTMLYMGVNERHIKFASGHSENSKSFERYTGFVEKMFNNDFTNYYEKLGI